ncbi:MAG TPA: hypothetical protein VLM20_07025, partial [Methylophilaceae bacterium]|nr:hypothetical protein [Methylophilaceae bacterium]
MFLINYIIIFVNARYDNSFTLSINQYSQTQAMDLDTLKQITQDTLQLAKQLGATSAEVEVSYGTGQNVTVRM